MLKRRGCLKEREACLLIQALTGRLFEEEINPFLPNVPFLIPLKTSENLWFSDVFRGIKREH